jgi:hypothetical protein
MITRIEPRAYMPNFTALPNSENIKKIEQVVDMLDVLKTQNNDEDRFIKKLFYSSLSNFDNQTLSHIDENIFGSRNPSVKGDEGFIAFCKYTTDRAIFTILDHKSKIYESFHINLSKSKDFGDVISYKELYKNWGKSLSEPIEIPLTEEMRRANKNLQKYLPMITKYAKDVNSVD